jgi:hypothetical protein
MTPYLQTIWIKVRQPKSWTSYLPWLVLFLTLYCLGQLIPEGFDWINYYKAMRLHPIWTPWAKYVLQVVVPFGYPLVFALSGVGIALRSYRYRRSPWPIALAFLCLPTLWVFYMGNLDGLVLFGLLAMPWGVPLVLMKPQVSAFALLANRKWLLAGVVWILISLVVWGFWPANLLMVGTPEWKAEWVQDISLFPWSMLMALPLLWFSRGDSDLLMAAGSLATPHLFPYHFILLAPSLARMRKGWMLLAWAVSWLSMPAANYFGAWAWHFGNLMSVAFWVGIYFSRSKDWSPPPEKAWFKEGTWLRQLERLAFKN